MPWTMALRLTLAFHAIAVAVGGPGSEIIVGNLRVQALSPTLLRVEPKGPTGYEDRTTFMVESRDFKGIPITKQSDSSEGTLLTTQYYNVLLKPANFVVSAPSGTILYDSSKDTNDKRNLLHWPAPLQASSYALTDYPRFFMPSWGTAPIPAGEKVDPALVATNGFDFRNNVKDDTYVFLLGSTLDTWKTSRSEFVQLAGACPLLPDFAYGTWFTYWHGYKEAEAKDDISHWENLSLPIDVWALDMNWRKTQNHMDQYYHYPNDDLFPNFTEWFDYLKEHKLRTYFNDHPYPVASRDAGGLQTSKEEVAFRWNGLSEWMGRGLTFWWFDHNWGFSIPPPFLNTSHTSGNWEGLDNAAWGSHVYFNAVKYYDSTVRDKQDDKWYGGRAMTLTKFGIPDWRPGMNATGHAESPAQHRYPVWWTGDGVNLQASVESMVDAGLYDLKPFVHSDCGGDYRGSAGDLLRWTAHCTYGSILRFHGSDHRAWTYDNHTVDVIRSYLNTRYKLIPSLISAGQQATATGWPLVARGDMYWPEHSESRTNDQYVFLDDVLVAPIFDSKTNMTSRSVWVPPGEWEDAWDGSTVTGPKTITSTQPYERQPMWHRKGGLLILADKSGTRVEDQDWSTLILEAFPSSAAAAKGRAVCEQSTERSISRCTDVTMTTDGKTNVRFQIGELDSGVERAWVVRVHLRPSERAIAAVETNGDHAATKTLDLVQLEPRDDPNHFPFAGAGKAPPAHAGPVLELQLPRSGSARTVDVTIGKLGNIIV